MTIIRKQLEDLSITTEELARLAQIRDEDIDFSDIPELDKEWFESAELHMPETKERLTMRLDRDIVTFFKRQGKGYQTRMNAVLRAYVEAKRRDETRPS